MEEVNVEPQEPSKIGFDLPSDISSSSIEAFIKESSNTSGATVEALIKRANNNPEGFINAIRAWEDKHATLFERQEIAMTA